MVNRLVLIILSVASLSFAGLFDDLKNTILGGSTEQTNNSEIIAGLKEALLIGTENAIKNVSTVNGYFGNDKIKILMPDRIQNVADVLSRIGFQEQVDGFILSMNRAAEQAAPKATGIFIDAIKQITFEDARDILNGGDTAATDYFREKTSEDIYHAFKPEVSTAMNEVGVTRSYKEMMNNYKAVPFMTQESLDLDHYVANEAMEGLFYMVGQEEKHIRTDPAARVTDLLKKVFGRP